MEVTAVERVETLPVSAPATGFILGITNELAARRSNIDLDSDLLLSNDDGVLLAAATLLAGAEHLLEDDDRPAHQRTPARPRPHRRRPHHEREHSPASS